MRGDDIASPLIESGSAARRVAAQATERVRPQLTEEMAPEDSSGYGVNLVNVRNPKDDIFDIPTFLRRQMD